MIITNSYCKKETSRLFYEQKSAIKKFDDKWLYCYYKGSDREWSYQEFIDAIESDLLLFGIKASEQNVLNIAEQACDINTHKIDTNIRMAIDDAIINKHKQQNVRM